MKYFQLFKPADNPVGGLFAYCTEEELEQYIEEFNPRDIDEISEEQYKQEMEIQHKRGFYMATGHWLR